MDNYPLLNVFLTMLYFFFFVAWIWLLIVIIGDVFRSHDMGGLAKALWVILIVIVPWLGVLVYLIARGGSMAERNAHQAAQSEAAFRKYVQNAAAGGAPGGSGGAPTTTDQLAKLAELHKSGVLNDSEFAGQKAKLLAA